VSYPRTQRRATASEIEPRFRNLSITSLALNQLSHAAANLGPYSFLEKSSLPVVVAQPDKRRMQKEQLLCWSSMTDSTEHTTSGLNEEEWLTVVAAESWTMLGVR